MSRVFSPKDPRETEMFVFNFTKRLPGSLTIASAEIVITVKTGIDPSPEALLSDTVVIEGKTVGQMLTGGLNGVTYIVTCTITTNTDETIIGSSTLSVQVDY